MIVFVYMGDWREYEISSFGNIKIGNEVNVCQHEVNKPLTASSLTISRVEKRLPQIYIV